jgi:hypothetical protein
LYTSFLTPTGEKMVKALFTVARVLQPCTKCLLEKLFHEFPPPRSSSHTLTFRSGHIRGRDRFVAHDTL